MEILHSIEHKGVSIEVVETQQTIYLQFDGGLKQSSFKKKNPKDLQKPYSQHMVKVLDHVPLPLHILVLGLGGGIIPKWLHENTLATIDVVEIVPQLKGIAETYFNLPVDHRMNVIIEDCNEYLFFTDNKYDIVFVDVFGAISSSIEDANAFHTGVKGVLKAQGMAAINSLVTKRNYDAHMKVLNSNYSAIIEEYVKLGRYSNNHITFCKEKLMSDFLKNIVKDIENDYATLTKDMDDDLDFIDTVSHIINGLLSGSIFGGLPDNKITCLAGESATGKTFFLMGIVKNFLDKNPDAGVLYFESESAITKNMIVERGIDPSRMVIVPVVTVQEFRTQSLKALDSYLAQDESDKKPLFLCLDSLGMLSTTKEEEDTAEGKETRDMTRAQVLKAAFRVLTLKLGRAKVPMVITNHTYDSMGSMFPTKEMGGGSGLKYAASSIIYLSKKKEKDGTEVIGSIVHCKNHKSRLTVEN